MLVFRGILADVAISVSQAYMIHPSIPTSERACKRAYPTHPKRVPIYTSTRSPCIIVRYPLLKPQKTQATSFIHAYNISIDPSQQGQPGQIRPVTNKHDQSIHLNQTRPKDGEQPPSQVKSVNEVLSPPTSTVLLQRSDTHGLIGHPRIRKNKARKIVIVFPLSITR